MSKEKEKQKDTPKTQSTQAPSHTPSALAKALNVFRETVYSELPGPKICTMRVIINIFKGLTLFWIVGLMFYFNNFCPNMYLYLFLHGTYGILWVVKDYFFPDSSFMKKTTLTSGIILALVLFWYWLMPVTIALGLGIQEPSQRRIIFCIVLYLSGAVLMMGSDYQKTTTLKKKKGLISTGFFARTRNPNYLGEVMIYGSFAACTGYWFSYVVVLSIWCSLFLINMYLKDEYSYKNKQGWKEYSKKSYMFLPKLFRSDFLNLAIYIGGVLVFYHYYQSCCDGHEHHSHQH